MFNPNSFLFEKNKHGVAKITLNRPEVLNAFDFRMLREIAAGHGAAIAITDGAAATSGTAGCCVAITFPHG